MRFRSSVAIDLGTVNTLVWVAGRGIVLEEPTAIAIDTAVGKVAAVGEAADALADKEPQDIQVIHPLRDGVIADLDATAAMLHAFLRRARRPGSLLRPSALVCVPSGATAVERRSIIAALSVRRPRYNVRLIDEPVAAAAGAGFDLTGGAGGFVVDIGGGTTEVAAVAGWRVVKSRSLRKAGNAMDEAIVQAARSELGLIISQRAARHLKTTLGVTGGAEGWAEVVGLDLAHRTPRSESVPGGLVATALEPIVSAIAGAVHEMLSEIPAGLAEDVVRGKVRLAGGGSLLPGLASRIETVAGIGTVLVEDPLRCVIRGAAEMLERKDAGKDNSKNATPGLRQLKRSFLAYSAGPPRGWARGPTAAATTRPGRSHWFRWPHTSIFRSRVPGKRTFSWRISASWKVLGTGVPNNFHEANNFHDLSRAGRIRPRPGPMAHTDTTALPNMTAKISQQGPNGPGCVHPSQRPPGDGGRRAG